MFDYASHIGHLPRFFSTIHSRTVLRCLVALCIVVGLAVQWSISADKSRRSLKLAEESAIEAEGGPMVQGALSTWWMSAGIPDVTSYVIRAIDYQPTGVIWLGGYPSASGTAQTVWRSTDHGTTWERHELPASSGTITGIVGCGTSEAVIGLTTGLIQRTTDNGNTWTTVFSYTAGGNEYIDGVRCINGDTLIAFGDADDAGLLVVRSTDRGATWSRITTLPAEEKTPLKWIAYASFCQSIEVYDRTIWLTTYYAPGTSPRIVKSTDGGSTWTSWPITLTGGNATNYYLRSLNFLNDSVGFAVDRMVATGSDYWLHITTDGGVTFSDTISLEPGVLHANARPRSVKPIRGTDTVIAVGFSNTSAKAWRSTNRGTTWSTIDPGSSGSLTNSAFPSGGRRMAVGVGQAHFYSADKLVQLISPNGGEVWRPGSSRPIQWTSAGIDSVKLEYSTDNGSSWIVIVTSAPEAMGSYLWTVPSTLSTTCRVRISDCFNGAVTDMSNAMFSISTSGVATETEPNNVASQANVMAIGDTVEGSISTSSDIDYFSFSAQAGDSLEVLAYLRNGSALDGYITLFDSTGSAWAYSWGGTGAQRVALVIPYAGRFFIRYSSSSNTGNFPNASTPDTPPVVILGRSGQAGQLTEAAIRDHTSSAVRALIPSRQTNSRVEGTAAPGAVIGDYGMTVRKFVKGPPFALGVWTEHRGSESASFVGVLDPNGYSSTLVVEYGPTPALGNAADGDYTAPPLFGSSYGIPAKATGLTPSSTVYYRMIAVNAAGSDTSSIGSFTTAPPANGWESLETGATGFLYGISFADSLRGFLTEYNEIRSTIDGGLHWTLRSANSPYLLRDIVALPGGKGIAVGGGGTVRLTTDGGIQWTSPSTPSTSDLYSITMSDSLVGYAVGTGGTIIKTTDGGATWAQQSSGVTFTLRRVKAVTGSIAWAVGDNGTMLKTSDGGTTWVLQSSLTGSSCVGLDAWGADTLMVLTSGNQVFSSSTGGTNWASHNISVSYSLRCATFVDARNAVAAGYGGAIVSTADGGATWTSEAGGTYDELLGITRTQNGTVMICGRYGTLLRSTPMLRVLIPNGGEQYRSGRTKAIAWSSRGVNAVAIDFTTNNGGSWSPIVASVPASAASYAWTVPLLDATQCRIRITNAVNSLFTDQSDAVFSITSTAPTAETEPNNTAAQANYMEIGDSLDAAIAATGDVDYYAFSATAGDTVEITGHTRNTSTLEGRIVLYSSSGSWLAEYNWGTIQRVAYAVTATGTYYIRYSYAGNYTSYPNSTPNEPVRPQTRALGTIPNRLLADNGEYRIVLNRFVPGIPSATDIWFSNRYWNAIQLHGGVSPNGLPTTVTFQYGPTTAYGSTVSATGNPVSGLSTQYVTTGLFSGLSPLTIYHARIAATNSAGTTYGPDMTFSTVAAPHGWVAQASGNAQSLVGVSMRGPDSAIVVAEQGVSLYTTNGGTNWFTSTSQGSNWIHAVASFGAAKAIAVSEPGIIRRTTDGGVTWTTVPSGTNAILRGVAFADSLRGFIAGSAGVVLRTTDGGLTWSQQTSSTTSDLYRVSMTDQLTATMVGSAGTIIRTTNGGTSWTTQTSGTAQQLWGVDFQGTTNGYAVGDGPTILRTTNGGSTWFTQTSASGQTGRDVELVDSLNAWIVGYSGMIQKTTNGGASWTLVQSGTANYLLSIDRSPDGTALIVGDYGTILRSTPFLAVVTPNGGEMWRAGRTENIRWSSSGVTDVAIDYSTNAGSSWLPVAASVAGSQGTYSWTVPATISTACLVRVQDVAPGSLTDQSDAVFSILGTAPSSEVEPNNTAGQANVMVLGDSLNGTITPNTDVDYFRFSAAVGDTIVMTMKSLTLYGTLYLYNSSGGMIQSAYGGYDLRLVSVISAAGTYYARLTYAGLGGGFPNAEGEAEAPGLNARLSGTASTAADTGAYVIALRRFTTAPPMITLASLYYYYSDAFRLIGGADPGGLPTSVWFDYGPTSALGSTIAAEGGSIVGVTPTTTIAPEVGGLQASTPYYFRVRATNALGSATGPIYSLTTAAASERWKHLPTGYLNALYCVARPTQQRIIAGGSMSDLMMTTNRGSTWSLVPTGLGASVYGIAFPDSLNGIAVSISGSIARSTNGGTTWTTVLTPTGLALYGVHFSNVRNGTAVGSQGMIRRTTDGGATWNTQSAPVSRYLRAVSFADSLQGVAVGDSGTVLHTTNAGASWILRTTGITAALRGVSFASPTTAVAVSDAGQVLRSSDGGVTWATVSVPTAVSLFAVAFSDSATGRAVGGSGWIYVTTNGGLSWTQEQSGASMTLRGIVLSGPATGTIVGSYGCVLDFIAPTCRPVANSAGWNLVSVPLPQSSMGASSLFPSASSSAFAFSGAYTKATTLTLSQGYWLKFPTAGTSPQCGTPSVTRDIPVQAGWNMIGSYDLETAVGTITSNPAGIVQSSFYGFNAGYTAAAALTPGKGYWVRVSEGGVLQIPAASPKTDANDLFAYAEWGGIVFEDEDGGSSTLWLAGEKELAGRTLDLPPVPPLGVLDVRFNGNTNIVERHPGSFTVSLSAGSSPLNVRGERLNGTLVRLRYMVDGKPIEALIAEGRGCTIGKAPASLTVEILGNGSEIPTEYALSQNYPNPFNPSTTIRFSIPQAGQVRLVVYDMLGSTVATLVDGEVAAGYHQAEFPAAGLASGVYFYKLEAGSFVRVQKMMLLK
jgi:photosystem II stability/assembly factor-like uncharacterized protein